MVRRSAGVPFLPFLVLSLVFAVCGSVHAGKPSGSSVQEASRGILRIKAYDWKGTLLRKGVGYFSSPDGNITTVVPVLEGGYYVEAVNHQGSERILEWINPLSQSSGLVFVRQEDNPPDFTYVEKTAPFPASGDKVWTMSFDEDDHRKFQKAIVLHTREVPGLRNYLFVRTSLPLGGAGSPLINEGGEVAGMVLLQVEGADRSGILVSTDLIRSSYGVSGEIVSLLNWTEERTTRWLEGEAGLYLKGFAFYREGNYQKAVDHLRQVVDTQRYGIRKANAVLGDCYRSMGETGKAIDAYEKALGRSRRLGDSHMNLARLYLKERRMSDARRIWEETARYDQKSTKSVILSAWLHDATGNMNEALAAARKATGMAPLDALAQGTLGELLSKQGRFDEAFVALEQSVTLRPDDSEFWKELCYSAIHSGRHEKAIKVCGDAARTSGSKALNLMYLGDAHAAAGLKGKALESYRRSVEEDPQNFRAWCRMGDLLAETGQYREAAAVFRSTASSLSGSAWIRFKLGKVYSLMGDTEAALAEVRVLSGLNQALADQLSLLLMQNKGGPGPQSPDPGL